MSRYEALMHQEQTSRRRLLRRLDTITQLAQDCRDAVDNELLPPVADLTKATKAAADLTDIWRANHHALHNRRPSLTREKEVSR